MNSSHRSSHEESQEMPQAFGMPFVTLILVLITFFIYLDSRSKPNAIKGASVAGEVRKQFAARTQMTESRTRDSSRAENIIGVARAAGFKVTASLDRYVLVLPGGALFESGDDHLSAQRLPALQRIADLVTRNGLIVQIEGHTDDRPISTPRFPSNWELSVARATAVLRVFLERGVTPSKVSAAGRSEFAPSTSNETDFGRSQNRRIVITITG